MKIKKFFSVMVAVCTFLFAGMIQFSQVSLAYAIAPGNENFDARDYLATTTNSLEVGSLTFTTDGATTSNDKIAITSDTQASEGGSQDPTYFTGKVIVNDFWAGFSPTMFQFSSTDQDNKFKMDSIYILAAMLTDATPGSSVININGYSGGSSGTLKASVTGLNLATSGSYGSGSDAIAYSKTIDLSTEKGGLLTFGSNWTRIDTIVISDYAADGNQRIELALDSLSFSESYTAPTIIALASQPDAVWNDGYLNASDVGSDRVLRLNLSASEAISGDVVYVYSDGTQIGSKTLDATDISNGYADVTIPTATLSGLSDGSHNLTAKLNTSPTSPAVSVTVDKTAPSGYGVSIDQAAINNSNKTALSFTFSGAEIGATYNYTISSGGGANVTGNGTITSTTQQVSGVNVSGLEDGTLTLSVTLTDSVGNTGSAATNTKTKDITPPSVADGTINTSGLTDTAVTLNWNKATDIISPQGVLQYLVYHSSSNNLDTVTNIETNGSHIESYTADIATKNVTGLTAGTTYYFNIIVKDEAGNKSCYTTKQVTTLAIPAYTATASAASTGPTAGADNAITLTVKDSLGNTDTAFTGDHAVTISGYTAAPGSSYGSFNGTALTASPNTISVTFAGGVASPNLALHNASAQTIGFSIAGVNTPATNTVAITPVPAAAASMTLTRDIMAPAANGGQFAQQPEVTLKDAFGNDCTNDSATAVTASKKDAGAWTLTGTADATASAGVVAFSGLGATNTAAVTGAQLAFDATGLTQITSLSVNLPAPAGAWTATALAATTGPTAGADNTITLTVKDSLGNTDTAFFGDHAVTISGYTAAPDSSYGSFNGTALTASPNIVSVTFTNGVASPNLALHNATAQTIEFSIDGVNTPETNTVPITPVPAVAASMTLTQDITAPAANGGQFAQQPGVTLKDAFGNTCANDSATVVTASKKDAGDWTLTGMANATVSAGVATFTNLGATNPAAVTGAQLAFDATGLTQITSSSVNLPEPTLAGLAITTGSLPSGTVGASYSTTLTATGGTAPYTWSATGLPPGLSLNTGGVISGTPGAAGTSTVIVTVHDSDSQNASASFSLTVNTASSALAVTSGRLPSGTAGTPYSATLTATGGTTPYTWSATGLPSGLSLETVTGQVYGTPTTPVISTVVATVHDSSGNSSSKSLGLTIATPIVSHSVDVAADGSNKNLGITDSTLNTTITIPGNVTDATINVGSLLMSNSVAGSVYASLPSITLNVITSISASPVQVSIPAGTKVSAASSANWDGTINVPTVLQANNTVTVIPDPGKNATVEKVIEIGFGDVPLTFDKAVRILFPGQAGKIVGYYQAGNFTKITNILDDDSQEAGDALPPNGDGRIDVGNDLVVWTKHFTKFVIYTQTATFSGGGGGSSHPPRLAIDTLSLNDATVGQPYTITISTNGKGAAPYTFSISGGAMPSGLSLSSGTGEISGTPTTPGSYTFTVTVNDANNKTASRKYTLNVHQLKEHPPGQIRLADISGHWAEKNIERLVAMGAVAGYPDGTFKPNKTITRAEFATILVKAFKLAPKTGKVFADTAGHWAKDAIETAASYGIVNGYDSVTFGPNRLITREQMAVMAVNAAKLSPAKEQLSFSDSGDISVWAKGAVAAVVQEGIMNGYPDNSFRPRAEATRAEAVTIIINTLNKSATD